MRSCIQKTVPLLCLLPLLVAQRTGASQPAQTDSAKKVISYDHLRDLSRLSNRVYDFRYNVYQFAEAKQTVIDYANLLRNTRLVWRVAVLRVTRTEVIYTFDSADRTTVAVIPGPEARAADSKHARYRTYPGPPTNRYFRVLGAPRTLRIGTAISLDVAKQLNRGDYIQVIGDVSGIETMVASGIVGENLVYVENVKYDTYSQELARPY